MKQLITGIFLLSGLLFAVPTTAGAQGIGGCGDNNPDTPCGVVDPACAGVTDSALCNDNSENQTTQDNTIFGPDSIMTRAARLITTVVGIAAVIMVIVGGIQYAISSGDSTNVNNAKNTILYAIIGLVVAVFARTILEFVLVRL